MKGKTLKNVYSFLLVGGVIISGIAGLFETRIIKEEVNEAINERLGIKNEE